MSRKFITKSIGGAVLSAIVMTSGAQRATADLGDALLGAGAAALIGCATGAINCNRKNQRRTTSSKPRSSINSAQRQENRNVQSALNAFGFPVGTVDGSLGPRSRAAIRDYQGYMGYPATGQLSNFERDTLVDSWQKFNAGAGQAYPRTMAAVGPRGLLNTQRDPNFPAQFGDNVGPNYNQGAYNPNQGTGGSWDQNNPGVAPNQPVLQPQAQQLATPAPQPGGGQVVSPALPKLQALKPIGQVAVSAAARCELVAQTTRIQGGVIRASNMTDADQALSEKFCEARGFAITQGQSVSAQFAVSENELSAICDQVQASFGDIISGLPSSGPDQVVGSVKTTAAELGLTDPATAAAYGQICIGIGYRLDNAEMALSGALAMLAADQAPYGELVGHHLREGFGVTASSDAAKVWYSNAVSALEQGATPAFVPSTTPERIQVIRAALQLQEQRAGGVQTLPQVIPASSQLPPLQLINQ